MGIQEGNSQLCVLLASRDTVAVSKLHKILTDWSSMYEEVGHIVLTKFENDRSLKWKFNGHRLRMVSCEHSKTMN